MSGEVLLSLYQLAGDIPVVQVIQGVIEPVKLEISQGWYILGVR